MSKGALAIVSRGSIMRFPFIVGSLSATRFRSTALTLLSPSCDADLEPHSFTCINSGSLTTEMRAAIECFSVDCGSSGYSVVLIVKARQLSIGYSIFL